MDGEFCSCRPRARQRAQRELSSAGYPVRRMRHVVLESVRVPQDAEIERQAYATRDYVLDAWYDDRSILHIITPGKSELNLFILDEPESELHGDDGDENRAFLEEVTLCLSLDAKVLLYCDDGGIEPYDALNPLDAAIIAPRILRALTYNRK